MTNKTFNLADHVRAMPNSALGIPERPHFTVADLIDTGIRAHMEKFKQRRYLTIDAEIWWGVLTDESYKAIGAMTEAEAQEQRKTIASVRPEWCVLREHCPIHAGWNYIPCSKCAETATADQA
jgi:hypothetical protein